jgi:alginate O-acetyltransferase complex protein AlgI
VYRGKQKAEQNFWVYALYVLYYPQLVAGPIERPQNILWQFHQSQPYDWARIKSGLLLMAWGMVKKVVIADRLALAVDPAYADPATANGPTLIVATIFYSFQIYCDFSGYSDIAIGASRVMGIKLMENFNAPYLARSITDFWRRWHISLSTWFRDYIYIPLGGNRVSGLLTSRNTLIIFLISGLWHGADWKFVVWGGLHGGYLIASQWLTRRTPAEPLPATVYTKAMVPTGWLLTAWQLVGTFALVSMAWVFFRAASVADGWLIWQKMGAGLLHLNQPLSLTLNPAETTLAVGLIGLLLLKDSRVSNDVQLPDRAFWPVLIGLVLACYFLGVFTANQFIYFQF